MERDCRRGVLRLRAVPVRRHLRSAGVLSPQLYTPARRIASQQSLSLIAFIPGQSNHRDMAPIGAFADETEQDMTRRNNVVDRIKQQLTSFGRDRRGNVAMIVAFAIIPLVGALGLAT